MGILNMFRSPQVVDPGISLADARLLYDFVSKTKMREPLVQRVIRLRRQQQACTDKDQERWLANEMADALDALVGSER